MQYVEWCYVTSGKGRYVWCTARQRFTWITPRQRHRQRQNKIDNNNDKNVDIDNDNNGNDNDINLVPRTKTGYTNKRDSGTIAELTTCETKPTSFSRKKYVKKRMQPKRPRPARSYST